MTSTITAESAEPLSPHTMAVHEAGVMLLKESIQTLREFCKSMIGTCFAAVPIYVTLIRLFISEEKSMPEIVQILWLLPICAFVLAACVFAAGYLPGRAHISLDLPEQVENLIANAINRRYWLSVIGSVLFSAGIAAGVAVLEAVKVTLLSAPSAVWLSP